MAQAANSALYSARLRFVEGLSARAQELSGTAERLARDPNDLEAVGLLRRRLHALLASAQVFEERALSLAVQDLIARLDVAQRAERVLTNEEIDAVSVVVASLPTYVRPTQPPAAYSDVRELREGGPRHSVPAPLGAAAPAESAMPAPPVVLEHAATELSPPEGDYPAPLLSEPAPLIGSSKADLLAALMPQPVDLSEPQAAAEPLVTLPEFLARNQSVAPAESGEEEEHTETMRRVEALELEAETSDRAGESSQPDADLGFGWSRGKSFDADAAGASATRAEGDRGEPEPPAAFQLPVAAIEPVQDRPELAPELARSGVYFTMGARPALAALQPSAAGAARAVSSAFASQRPAASPLASELSAGNSATGSTLLVDAAGVGVVLQPPAAERVPALGLDATHRAQTASGIFSTRPAAGLAAEKKPDEELQAETASREPMPANQQAPARIESGPEEREQLEPTRHELLNSELPAQPGRNRDLRGWPAAEHALRQRDTDPRALELPAQPEHRAHGWLAAERALGLRDTEPHTPEPEQAAGAHAEPAAELHEAEALGRAAPMTDGVVDVAPDDAVDPRRGPAVLLKQTVSGLLPVPRPAVVLLVAEAVRSSRLQESFAAGELELVEAHGADEAIRMLREITPDLVLVSAELASSPEDELVRRLKSDPLTPVPHVHVLLGEGATYDESFLEQIGADGIVREPLTAAALRPLLAGQQLFAAEGQRAGVREGTIDDIAGQIAEEIRRGIAESLRVGKHERVRVGDGSELMAAAWSAIGRVRSHLAEQNRGRVRIREDDRRLASLSPSLAADAADGSAPPVHPAQLLAGCRVLIADDDPAVLWFFAGLLREASAQVLQAHNGREALDLARRKQPHVIVSDILMPKLDGFGLCRELKRDALLAHVPVILLSWKDDLLQRMRELDAGAAGYLRKEAGSQQILTLLAEVLRPRARLTAKLRGHAEVSGAIEEIGVASLFELVAAERSDARIAIRDAAHLFEVDIRGGRRLFVTRTAADGSFTSGEKALMQLLGIDSGKFAVSSSATPLRAFLPETLDRALIAAGRRLAALLDAVSDARLLRVSLLAFDDEVLQSLMHATSTRLPEVVALFRTGAATAESVLCEGKFAPAELENYLRELARGVAITGVWSADGEDLVAAAQRERETPQLALLSSPSPPRQASGSSWPAARSRDSQDRMTPSVALDPITIEAARSTRSDPPPSSAQASVAPGHTPESDDDRVTVTSTPAVAVDNAAVARAQADTDPCPAPLATLQALHALHSGTVPGIGPVVEATAEGRAAVGVAAESNADAVSVAELEHFDLRLPGVWVRARERAEGLRLLATLVVLAAVGYFGWQQLKPKPVEREPNVVLPQPEAAAPEGVVRPQPEVPNTQFGRVLPFIDPAPGVAVAADEGLLVVEYHGAEPPPNVRVGERELGKPPLAVALAPGRHELVLRMAKSTSFRYLIVRAGETRIVSLPLVDL